MCEREGWKEDEVHSRVAKVLSNSKSKRKINVEFLLVIPVSLAVRRSRGEKEQHKVSLKSF